MGIACTGDEADKCKENCPNTVCHSACLEMVDDTPEVTAKAECGPKCDVDHPITRRRMRRAQKK